MSDEIQTNTEYTNPKYNPTSEEFDREAYRKYLVEQHEQIMSQSENRTWRIEPTKYDIYSEAFDVDEYIKERINAAQRSPELFDLMQDIAIQTIEQLRETKHLTPKDMAKIEGVVTTIKDRITVPSSLSMEDVFSPSRVKMLPSNSVVSTESGEVQVFDDSKVEDAQKVNAGKMAALLRMREVTTELPTTNNGFNIQVYLPKICKEISIDPRKYSTLRKADQRSVQQQRFDTFARWIAPLETYMSEIDGVYYRVCTVEKYDELAETVTLNMPYFFRLYEQIQETHNNQVTNKFFHADVANEENEIAIDVAFYLGNSILRRGIKPDKPGETKVTYRTSYSTLITNVPTLRKALKEILTRPRPIVGADSRTADFNITFKRIIETAFRILLEKSEFTNVYQDFAINGVTQWEDPASKKRREKNPTKGNRRTATAKFNIPTKTYLSRTLKITHNGKREIAESEE